jgi:predicted CopG family antitoxin
MSRTSIPVDSATKKRLDRLKRDDETWDEFLERMTATEETIEAGAWSDEEAEQAKESIRKSRENWR